MTKSSEYRPRLYREVMGNERWISFRVEYLETDLWIAVSKPEYEQSVREFAFNEVSFCRNQLERHIDLHPEFLTSLAPLKAVDDDLPLIAEMYRAAEASGTGPMSAVAGAVSEYICSSLVEKYGFSEVVVENGGDIFMKLDEPVTISVFAGDSPLSDKIGIGVMPSQTPLSVCCSSATVGHSLSFGTADAAVIACRSGALADAYATACCNAVKSPESVAQVTGKFLQKSGVQSVVIIMNDKVGIGGSLEIVFL